MTDAVDDLVHQICAVPKAHQERLRSALAQQGYTLIRPGYATDVTVSPSQRVGRFEAALDRYRRGELSETLWEFEKALPDGFAKLSRILPRR